MESENLCSDINCDTDSVTEVTKHNLKRHASMESLSREVY